MIRLLRKLLNRPNHLEKEIALAASRLRAKRLVAKQFLATTRMGKQWIAADKSTFVAWNQETEPRSLRVVIPLKAIPTLRMVA